MASELAARLFTMCPVTHPGQYGCDLSYLSHVINKVIFLLLQIYKALFQSCEEGAIPENARLRP